MHRAFLPLVALATISSLHAQTLIVADPAGGMFVESTANSILYPAGAGGPLNTYPMVPLVPPVAPFAGAVTIDTTNGTTWYTGGAMLVQVPHSAYAPGVFLPPPFPPTPGALAGPITGMALDPAAGLLWVTDGFIVQAQVAVPGGPIVVPPFGVLVPVIAPPFTGLEWDGLTGSLWACDLLGAAYNFAPGGAMIAMIPPTVPALGPALGITIDKTGLPNPTGARPVYVTGGGIIVDVIAPIPVPSGGSGTEYGLTFHPAPQPFPFNVCPCPNYVHGQSLRGPCTTGNPNFGVDLVGLPPGNLTIFAYDFAFNPAFPAINSLGCNLGFTIGSPTLIAAFSVADPTGTASSVLPLVGVPPGSLIFNQIATVCPADATLGLVLSPLYRMAVSGL